MNEKKTRALAKVLVGTPLTLLLMYTYVVAPVWMYLDYGWAGALAWLGCATVILLMVWGFIRRGLSKL